MRLFLFLVFLSGCNSKTLLNPHHAPWATPNREAYTATADNLRSVDLVLGRGAEALNGMQLTVHYNGWLRGGRMFDSSRERGQPFTAVLGRQQLIPGWEEGMLGMRVGGVRQLIIPPSLAYADREMGSIPPNSQLVFEIELLGVHPAR
ncbi:MAG: peptidylprolyl isomerase [Myxococcota bacterium]|jgi:peptidylprolyl isomerase